MLPIEHIRRNVLKITQAEMAALAGVWQTTVSRWEKGTQHPDAKAMAAIREEAFRRELPWDDTLFFAVPASAEIGRPDESHTPSAEVAA